MTEASTLEAESPHQTPAPAVNAHSREVVLGARPLPLGTLLRETWNSRRLLLTLGRQEFFVRYRRASLGIIWAVALPLVQSLVLAIVFKQIVKFKTDEFFFIYVLGGLTVWSFFGGTVSQASTAIVDGTGLASKIYFPRAVLPMIKLVSSAYAYAISVTLLVIIALVSGVPMGVTVLWLVPATILLFALTLSISLVLSALHVFFRDIRFMITAAITVWFYATPIFYHLDNLTGVPHTLLLINPVTGVVELVRAATVGADPGWELAVATCCAWTAGLLALAMILHRRFDRVFSDRL